MSDDRKPPDEMPGQEGLENSSVNTSRQPAGEPGREPKSDRPKGTPQGAGLADEQKPGG